MNSKMPLVSQQNGKVNSSLSSSMSLPLPDYISMSPQYYESHGDITAFKRFAEKLLNLSIKPFHLEWVKAFYNNPRNVIISHRGSGKTTILGVAFPLWIVTFKLNKTFLIVSANMRESTKIISQIRNYINSVEYLSALKPSSSEYHWTKQDLHTTTNCRILCRPYTQNIRGVHVDYILADEASQFQDTSIYYSAIVPMVAHKNGHIMVIGTRQTETDLLGQLIEKESGYFYKSYPVIDTKTKKPLWPEKFSIKKIKQIKKDIGNTDFAREYLNLVVPKERQVFPPELVAKALDSSIALDSKFNPDSNYYLGCDLALSPHGDYSVFTTIENLEDKLYIRNVFRRKGMNFHNQINKIVDLHSLYQYKNVTIDESNWGPVLLDELRRKHIPVSGVKFTPENRNNLINNLRRIFESEQIVIPYSKDNDTRTIVQPIIKELTRILSSTTKSGMDTYKTIGKYDDCVMSLALACYSATKQRHLSEIPVIVSDISPSVLSPYNYL